MMSVTMMVAMMAAEDTAEAGVQHATGNASAAHTLRVIAPPRPHQRPSLEQRGNVQGGGIDRDALPGPTAVLDAEADGSSDGRAWLECV